MKSIQKIRGQRVEAVQEERFQRVYEDVFKSRSKYYLINSVVLKRLLRELKGKRELSA